MAITIDGSANTIAGIASGGLNADAVGIDDLNATGTASSSTYLRGDNTWSAAGVDNVTSDQYGIIVQTTNTNNDSTVLIKANEAKDARVLFQSDEGDDNADLWRLNVIASNNTLAIQNYAGGAWEDSILLYGNGAAKLYKDNALKAETTTAGFKVTGDLEVTGTAPGGGLSDIDQYQCGGFSTSGGNGDLTANWNRLDQTNMGHSDFALVGGAMSESSGIFTFPSTGLWLITHTLAGYAQNTDNRIVGNRIYSTTNNSSYSERAHGQWNVHDFSSNDNGVGYGSCYCEYIFDVTSTTNCKVKFWWQSEANAQISGGNGNHAKFIKLAET